VVLLGIILCVVLAVLLDTVIVLAGRRLTAWNRAVA
jgi:hypothetical protein